MTISDGEIARIKADQTKSFQDMRALQGNPTLDVIREQVSGDVPERGVEGTVTDVGIQGVECTRNPVSKTKREELGILSTEAVGMFVIYNPTNGGSAFPLRKTDKILFRSQRYDIKAIDDSFPSGRIEIVAHLAIEV